MTANTAITASFAYDDLRDWLAEAERLGELETVRGASWEKETGLATELLNHSEAAPCVLFEDVPGCPKGFRLLVNFFGGRRTRMTPGFSTNLSKMEPSDAFLHTLLKDRRTIPAQMVESGPVFDNVVTDDAIRLFQISDAAAHCPVDGVERNDSAAKPVRVAA
jgi:4-hydroxy-3-polyprenylbenzoate decarboxylase